MAARAITPASGRLARIRDWSSDERQANMGNLRREPEKRRFRRCESESTSDGIANGFSVSVIGRYFFGLASRRRPRCASVIDHMTTSVQGVEILFLPPPDVPQYQ